MKYQKPTIWARQNKGVASRAGRDVELEEISKPTLDSARAALERKAKIYDKLRKGKTGGLNDAQYDALLVDVCGQCLLWPCAIANGMVGCSSTKRIQTLRNTTKKTAKMRMRV